MNKILFALPVVLAGFGCTAQSDTSNAAPTGETNAVTTEAPEATSTPQETPLAEKPTVKPVAGGAKADSRYKVAEEVQPGMPEDLVAALKKVAVAPPPADFKVPANARVRFVTNKGPIVVQLETKEAPLHAKSFYYLTTKGFFNGTVFHRWADLSGDGKGYIIQGGDPLSRNEATRGYAGVGGPGYQIPRERNKLTHQKFVLAAARSQDPDSAGSQFYFTQGSTPFLDEGDGYTVFGKIVEGQANAAKLTQDDKLTRVEVVK